MPGFAMSVGFAENLVVTSGLELQNGPHCASRTWGAVQTDGSS